MKNQYSKPKVGAALAGLILGSFYINTLAQEGNVLDPTQHPSSPEVERVYQSEIVPLDATLSWTKRFNGDETFSTEQVNIEMVPKDTMTMKADNETAMPNMNMDASGVVKSVRLNQGKVKISHGPIDKYGMPEMTMVFKVKETAMLEGLTKGEKISFNVDNSSGGFIVTQLMAMTMAKPENFEVDSQMDASGVVKLIRPSQGKVKISHGPIEKYGMPSMTMVFKVSDPSLLSQLEKGAKIDFDIDNSSGGFVITNIHSTAN